MNIKNILGSCLAVAALATGSLAQADQLQDIKEKGELVCGTLGTSQPFSFQDAKTRELIGYDVDFCKLIADKLGVDVEFQMMSVAARIPSLTEGRVDILAANLGYSPERAEQIDFSNIYYTTPQKLLVRADSDFTEIDQLNGKRIGATRGSSSEREIKKILSDSQVVGYSDSSSAYLALQQKKVEAQFASELVLVRLMLQSPPTAPVTIMDKAVFEEPWGLGVRKDQAAFLSAVNEALVEAEESGEAAKIFEKWFGTDTQYKLKRSFIIHPVND